MSPPAPVDTPCIKICKMGPDGLCLGCRRTRDEIAYWGLYRPEERRRIMAGLPSRVVPPGPG